MFRLASSKLAELASSSGAKMLATGTMRALRAPAAAPGATEEPFRASSHRGLESTFST